MKHSRQILPAIMLFFICTTTTLTSQVCVGESIPVGNESTEVQFAFTLDANDDIWNHYIPDVYFYETYEFSVDITGSYNFSQTPGQGIFTCLMQGFDENEDFYDAPNLLGFNFANGDDSPDFNATLIAGTSYFLVLKSESADVSQTATISGPGNITFHCLSTAPIPTMTQWTLMILGLLLTSLAVVQIRKNVLA